MYHIPPHLNGYGDAEPSFAPIGLAVPPIEGYGMLSLPAAANGYGAYHGYGAFADAAALAPVVNAAPPPPVPAGPPVHGGGQPVKVELGTGGKVLLFGLGGLLLAGIGYMVYQEIRLKQEIVKAGGGKALAEYELAKAAGTAAGSLGSILGGRSAQPNRRRRARGNRRGRR